LLLSRHSIVHNISQAWGSNPPAWPIIKGWGTPHDRGRIRGSSLGRAQWPSCLTTPATSLSCPHPQAADPHGQAGEPWRAPAAEPRASGNRKLWRRAYVSLISIGGHGLFVEDRQPLIINSDPVFQVKSSSSLIPTTLDPNCASSGMPCVLPAGTTSSDTTFSFSSYSVTYRKPELSCGLENLGIFHGDSFQSGIEPMIGQLCVCNP